MAHNATFDVGFMNATTKDISYQQFHNWLLILLEFARNLYPEHKRHGQPLTKRFGGFGSPDTANYDAKQRNVCCLSS